MKFYVAGPWNNKEEVRAIQQTILDHGHEITVDWTLHPSTMPHETNAHEASRQAVNDLKGIQDCEVFIIVTNEAGRGMYVELGAALARAQIHQPVRVFAVGEHSNNSVFYFHPLVKRCPTIYDVFTELQ